MIRYRNTLLYVLAFAPLLLLAAGCGQTEATGRTTEPPEPIQVAFAPVDRASIRAELDLVGTLIPLRATTVVSDVDGRIASFPASQRSIEYEEAGQTVSQALGLDLGHAVRKGEVLVQIDPVDFELGLNMAKAEHELAKRNLDELLSWRREEEILQLEAALEEARASNVRAQADLERSEQLLSTRAVSRSQFDEVKATAQMAAAGVKRAEAALALAKAGPTAEEVAVAKARVESAAAQVAMQQEKLDKTTIRAPYDAVISDRYIDVGDRVTAMPRVEIMQIIDPQVLFAQVPVPERYQGVVRLDDVATITAEGIPVAFPARIDLINAKIEPETRTFRIRITVDNRQGLLKAGGFVRVALRVGSAADVPVVPLESVVFTEGRPAVFVQEKGHVRRVPVEVGISNGRMYEIASGVLPGQEVAVNRTSLLTDGMPVTAVRAPAAEQEEPSASPPVTGGESR
jgi:HlyD family secretion protein